MAGNVAIETVVMLVTRENGTGLTGLSVSVHPPSVCDGSFRFLFASKDSQHKPEQQMIQMPHLSKTTEVSVVPCFCQRHRFPSDQKCLNFSKQTSALLIPTYRDVSLESL